VIGAVVVIWLVGALILYVAERQQGEDYNTYGKALWSVWVLLFSGEVGTPKSVAGQLAEMVLLVAGVGLAGLFTASVASILVERYLRRREMSHFEMDDHLVLCNWAPRALEWIREVHSKIITDPRPIVIIHDNPDEIDLPDKQDEPAFNDVYIVKGDPTNEVVLNRARVSEAYSVVILSDGREGKHADGKSILTCIAVRHACRKEQQPNVVVELHNPSNRFHLLKAGASEIVSSDSLGLRLLARSALFHGMTQFYQELLTVRRDANEVYLLPITPELVGRDFADLGGMFMRYRNDRRSCLLIGIQRGDEMLINPIGDEAGPLKPGDQLILLSRIFPSGAQALPTNPPVAIQANEKTSK
jgi:voltage-gated potassium channel